MTTWYLLAAGTGFAVSALSTPVVRSFARRHQIIDDPAVDPVRKRHVSPVPFLGGLAVIFATICSWWILQWTGGFRLQPLPPPFLIGLTLAALIIAIGGAIDDRRHLRPAWQLVTPILATLVIIFAGIGVSVITNPFGGSISLDTVTIWHLPWLHNGAIYLAGGIFSFIWLMGSMYTTKILDGLDGLVSGLGVIGAIIIFFLTLRPDVHQSSVGLLAMAMAGACAGFLIYNWHPAKIFLGESGSLYIGFFLGVLAIIAGGKIATALLIMGLPILDLAWVIFRRVFRQRRSPFQSGDRSHLHFRLLDAGLSIRQSVILLYGIMALFGAVTLLVGGRMKIIALGLLALVMILLATWVGRRSRP